MYNSIIIIRNIHVLMRDEKEGRKKQARSNNQQGKATQHTQGSLLNELPQVHVHIIVYSTNDCWCMQHLRMCSQFVYII